MAYGWVTKGHFLHFEVGGCTRCYLETRSISRTNMERWRSIVLMVPCSSLLIFRSFSFMLVMWRQMLKKAFDARRMEGRVEELNLLEINQFPISQITAVITPDFMCGEHHYIWSETRTNRCSLCD